MGPKKGANGGKKATPLLIPDDNVVFERDNSSKKKGKERQHVSLQEGASATASKPTARQVVAGASWTGKLPVNLLSEHCQKRKWNKPEYSMRQIPAKGEAVGMYRSEVTLSKTDPKTAETVKLRPFRLPDAEAHLANQPSALEARHFAATYTLFRIQSMKQIHMALPPKYRDLWKGEFSRLKNLDVDAGQIWKYEEDPFAAEVKRQEIHRAMDKRKEEDEKKQAVQAEQERKGIVVPLNLWKEDRTWQKAPEVAMGQQIRLDAEELVRRQSSWNSYESSLSKQQKTQILANVVKLGFCESHIEEALDVCGDQQEVLEWLLIHLPESDLPPWTFPSNYNAGVSLASGDLERERHLKSLAATGYPSEICAQTLKYCGGDERLAASALQQLLVSSVHELDDGMVDSTNAWEEEMATLEAIFGDDMHLSSTSECSVKITITTGQTGLALFQCPRFGYPQKAVPAISIIFDDIPAYIRLSAIKRTVQYAQEQLFGEVMVYSICQFLESELPATIKDPGPLSEIRLHHVNLGESRLELHSTQPKEQYRKVRDRKRVSGMKRHASSLPDSALLDIWKRRQDLPDQKRMMQARQALPAWINRDEIVAAIQSQQLTIISGETGSGKSTQVVQFVLDAAIHALCGSSTKILCTQPRRVAALSLSERVSAERCSEVGDEVGYVIRGESKTSQETKITFMTTGVLLRRLQAFSKMSDALSDVSHVFIDEVHERSLDTDFLLALLKECMEILPQLKIILMSATLDAEVFVRYFGGSKKVSRIHIEGRTFPVEDVYLEDIVNILGSGEKSQGIGRSIQNLGFGIHYDLIASLVQHIDDKLGSKTGSVLIFMPGTMEIERCLKSINAIPRILGLPIHASLLPVEQRKVFLPAPSRMRKVIVATNVAETSITIEDVVAVIDTGRVKETRYDAENNIVRLEEVWASLAACKQRRGRAGRVRAGTCYKLFTKHIEGMMSSKNIPEIKRVPLEQLCLSVKATGADRDIAEFLSRTITPPDSSAVSVAIKTLHAMNALENGKLTALGSYLAMIPADLRCAKLLVYGALFDCLESCLTVAAILTVKSPFTSPANARDEAKEARLKFPSTDGDLLLDMSAFDQWSEMSAHMRHAQQNEWCSVRFISSQTMRDIASTRRQLLDSLKDAGLVDFHYRSPTGLNQESLDFDRKSLLSALIAGALQPQLAQILFPSKKYIASMSGAKELNPEARAIKFFISDDNRPSAAEYQDSGRNFESGTESEADGDGTPPALTRVFIHPASSLFSAQVFPRQASHLSYFTKMVTSKPFIRDLTPLNIYSLLFFGGKVELDTCGRGLIVGGIWKVQGWARIGVLISRLRGILDEELRRKIEDGGILMGSMKERRVVQVVKRLLILNGQDK